MADLNVGHVRTYRWFRADVPFSGANSSSGERPIPNYGTFVLQFYLHATYDSFSSDSAPAAPAAPAAPTPPAAEEKSDEGGPIGDSGLFLR